MFDQTPNQQPYGAPTMGGYQFNGYQAQQVPKVMNVLSDAEIKELQQTNSQFSLGLTERETLQAACNHRSADGTSDTLVFDQNTGVARCTICGYEFRPIEPDMSYESIKDSADRIVDILQTIKIMYTEIPANAAREYFQIIPLIGKIPQLFEYAAKNFSKHEYNAWNYVNHNMGGAAMFQNLNNMFGASQMQPQFQQQPMYNNAYAAQPGQPVGYPTAPQGNPFGYAGASMGGYQPQMAGYQFQPAAQPTPVEPTVQAPAVPTEVVEPVADTTVTATVTV